MGSGPYEWGALVPPTLPAGMAFNRNTGVLSGTPTQAGTFELVMGVTDLFIPPSTPNNYQRPYVRRTVSLIIYPIATQSVRIVPGYINRGEVGVDFEQQLLAAAGNRELPFGPYHWHVSSGSLPPGIVLDSATGRLSGRPTQAGTFPVSLSLEDCRGQAGGTTCRNAAVRDTLESHFYIRPGAVSAISGVPSTGQLAVTFVSQGGLGQVRNRCSSSSASAPSYLYPSDARDYATLNLQATITSPNVSTAISYLWETENGTTIGPSNSLSVGAGQSVSTPVQGWRVPGLGTYNLRLRIMSPEAVTVSIPVRFVSLCS